MPERFVTIKEAAARVALSRTSIYRRIADGTFPEPVALGPATVRFVESEIEAWIQARIDEEPAGVDWRKWRSQRAVAARRDRQAEAAS